MKSRSWGLAWPALVIALMLFASCQRARTGTAAAISGSVDTETQLRAAFVAARQAEGAADPAYGVRALQGGSFVATHPGTGMRAEMGHGGVALSKPGEPWHATLAGARVACAGSLSDLASVAPRAGTGANRVEYAHGTVTEWYANGPLGLEQGFTLGESPCAGDVVIEVSVEGLSAADHGVGGGAGVDLRDAGGVTRVRYTDLSARDADGRALPAQMAVEGAAIALRVATGGARFPVVVDPLAWAQQTELSDGATDGFGFSVSLSGSTAVVGTFTKTIGSNLHQGAAYVFVQSAGTWTQQAELVASDGATGDEFGYSVSVSGSMAVVGAWHRSVGSGAAYVFVQSGTTWTQQAELLASDGAAFDAFGYSVAVSGSTAVVGAQAKTVGSNAYQGAAYVFVQSGSSWTQQAELVASDGAANDLFGTSVSVSGSTAVVGAFDKTVGSHMVQGAAYVFVQSGSSWTQQAELVGSDGTAGDEFGVSVSVSGSTAVVGARGKGVGGTSNQGVTYVFVESGSSWTQQAELVASDGTGPDAFGASVCLLGSTAIVGAPGKAVGGSSGQGAAYVFVQSGSSWTQQAELFAIDGAMGDQFGVSVSVSGGTAVVGANLAPVGVSGQGIAYVEDYGPANGSPCSISTDCASSNCVGGLCCSTPCGPCGSCTTGNCSLSSAGSPGSPSCAPYTCSGSSATCRTSCTSDTECTATDYCNGGLCTAKLASGTTCTRPDQCASGHCVAGLCAGTQGTGTKCTAPDQCASEFCVDGLCCNVACTSQCQACDAAGLQGTCSQIIGAPHGKRTACAGTGACAGSCSAAAGPSACALPGATMTCGSTCSGNTLTPSNCDGKGDCVAETSVPCSSKFVCADSKACKTSCASGADCVSGFACVAGACVQICKGVSDCVSPDVCNASGQCVPATSTTAASGGCSVAPGAPNTAGASVLFGIALLAARRRRRAAPSRVHIRRSHVAQQVQTLLNP